MQSLSGVRVLLVEDEPFLQLELQDTLEEFGCRVVARTGHIEAALKLAADGVFDIALLDMNLHGVRIDPVAETLTRRGLPFIFLTGYGTSASAGAAPVIEKPYAPDTLRRAMMRILGVPNE